METPTPPNYTSAARRREFQQIAAKTLDAALSERETHVLISSLKHFIRARGYAATARKAGLNRTALYKILFSSGNPKLITLIALLSAVGFQHTPKARALPIRRTQEKEDGGVRWQRSLRFWCS